MALQTVRFRSDPQLVAASQNKPPLVQGARGEGVAILQQALVDLGLPMPNSTASGLKLPDGRYGPETAGAIRTFQRTRGLKQDGIAGQKTLTQLEQSLIAKAQFESAQLVAEMNGPIENQRIIIT